MDHSKPLQPAYVIHTRHFRETSLIVNFFTRDFGKVSAVAKGARRRRNKATSVLQAFMPLEIAWLGRRELKTLTILESPQGGCFFSGNTLVCGLYLNELMYRLLKPEDPHPAIFTLYENTVTALKNDDLVAPLLRKFEQEILTELGYALCLTTDYLSGEPIDSDVDYFFDPLHGITRVQHNHIDPTLVFPGASLLKINQMQYDDNQILRDAKRLFRLALAPLLGTQPIKAREILTAVRA